MKSIIFFVATIATVLAVPYYPALQVYSNGAVAPVETPEVQHEKAKHFAAHAERAHGYAPIAHYAAPHAYGYHVPVIHNGVPVDTPEVQHAKAAHFAAYAKAAHAPAPVHHVAHAAHYHVPVIHNGVPVDTPEVQHAKAAHFAAVAKAGGHAAAHYDHAPYYHGDDGSYKPDHNGY
ncbi:cuticle protein 18.7 isoform X3 [Culicoides brevitarsis]|uniref:cuticle protein 18.7 isoform X3 n=1 Tax=Culicoides brevitarsis TaxID=469753 RepID=UPI00307C2084